MAEKFCPTCGKSNPEDALICQFCGARLEAEDLPDWLSALRTPSAPSGGEAGGGEDLPDWLKEIRSQSEAERGTPLDLFAPEGGEEEAPIPDWLSGLSGGETPSAGAEEPLPWEIPAESAATPPESPAPAPSAEEGDWLSGLREWQTPAEEVSEIPPEAGFSLPEQPEEEFTPREAIPDDMVAFFASLGAQTASAEQPAEEEAFPWSAGFGAEETAPAEQPAGEELPPWVAGFGAEETTPAGQPAGEELPPWLAGAGFGAEETAPAEQPAGEELPPWLAGFGAEETAPAGQPAGEELPPWMAGFGAEETTPAGQPAGEELPPWVAGAGFGAEETAPAEQPAGEELPPWMAETPSTEEAPAVPEWVSDEGFEKFRAEHEQPAPAPAEESGLPDWLTTFGKMEEKPEEMPAEPVSPFVDESLPEWLSGVKPPPEPAGPAVPPLIEPEEQPAPAEGEAPFAVELPEWLGTAPEGTAEMAEQTPAVEEETPAESLAPAELPAWVEEMRPLEAVLPSQTMVEEGEQRLEEAGPLKGLVGVIAGEEIVSRYRKPPAYSVRLKVSERQRANASLLENVLALEAKPREVVAEASRAPQVILRVILALLLVLSLLTMLAPSFTITEMNPAAVPGLQAFYQRVNALPENAPVLLAVEYEPSHNAEMRFASSALLRHLMDRNARLFIVSTVVGGPVLADELVREAALARPQYVVSERALNLGYLAGGTTSLLEFAQNPRRAAPSALDTALTGVGAWDRPVAQGVNSIQDFVLVIVLTDSPEVGRAWVEQVQPLLGSVPLMMITSAQAEPMLAPYLGSAQVQGLVSGLRGGAGYERL
ncbi:zinc ribbon domain-containing protein, partial [Anaerolinea sp.]|uniref:zinc ribbon domain-containing protein n=1 Tax=Anaerolinea sp. TaxID=1872519 RepID=UPI002ACDFA81